MIAHRPNGRRRAHVGALILGVACLACRPTAAGAQIDQVKFWSSATLAEYRAILEAYQDGEVDDALALLLESKGQGRGMVDLAKRVYTGAPDPAIAELLATAVMLHTDAAAIHGLEGRPQEVLPHLDAARRWADLLEPGSPPIGSFRRRWYLGAGLLLVEQARLGDALRHLELAHRVLPDDVDVLTTTGWIYERFALAPALLLPSRRRARPTGNTVQSAIVRKEADLKEAVNRFTIALTTDPRAPEPALRLARIRLLQGQTDEGRRRLLELAGRSIPPEVGYVARLLLGRLDEREGKPDEARRHYAHAMALVPDGQSAPIALAALQHVVGQPDTAGGILDGTLTAPRDELRDDPWSAYLNGALRRGRELRNALRAEVLR